MHRLALVAVAALLVLGAAAPDSSAGKGKVHLYIGMHPIDDHTFCYIEAPHQHLVAPTYARVQYRVENGYYHFVGDPVAFHYDGPKYAYYGAHPIHVDAVLGPWARYPHDDEYCYIQGPHYHYFAPAEDPKFVLKGDAYWYVGTLPPRFEKEKPRYGRINHVYADVDYVRPVVEVTPPEGFVGVVVATPGVDVHADVVGGVEVLVPEPVVEVDLGLGIGVGHVHHHHGKHRKFKHRGHGRRGYFRRSYTRRRRHRR